MIFELLDYIRGDGVLVRVMVGEMKNKRKVDLRRGLYGIKMYIKCYRK